MTGLIDEIIRDASDGASSVSTLLRRMKVAAARLKLPDAIQWIEHELNGYPPDMKLPEYRCIGGVPQAHFANRGWQNIALGDDPKWNAMYSIALFNVSIAEVEAHLDGEPTLRLTLMEELERIAVSQYHGVDKVAVCVGRGKMHDILNGVRNRALDWALALDAAGVTGEGMSFTVEEKKAAASVTIHNNHLTLSGTGNRAYLNSTDNSVNSISENVFGNIRTEIEQKVTDPAARIALTEAVSAMEKAEAGSSIFAKAYARFVGLAADHLGLLAFATPLLEHMLPK